MFRPCILLPSYNNATTLGDLLKQLSVHKLPILVVNDGSTPETKAVYEALEAQFPEMCLINRDQNGGKGAAVQTGLHQAIAQNFTHALQMDADGQHDPQQVQEFLTASKNNPEALILGAPLFGEDVPKSRLYGRQVSRCMVWLQTLSFQIEDPLFGYRVYPLAATHKLLQRKQLGMRMDFDPEIAVRLVWQGLSVHNIKSKVCYPEGNASHFQMFRDNFRLSWLHTRLIIGMLFRSPILLARHFS